MRLLLVDDSSTMRRIQRTQLTVLGISDIIEAENGEEALTKYADMKPDVVLMDILMPRLDGTWTKKGKKSYFGYKLYQKIDVDYSLIRDSQV